MNFSDWKQYFLINRDHFDHLDHESPDELTSAEKQLIGSSIAQFQKGELSEGKNLKRRADQYSRSQCDMAYSDTITLFVKEEQRHAMVLAQFMRKHNIPLIRQHWVDDVFKGLRRYLSFELGIIVLLAAEIISSVYYRGLFHATKSVLLRDICSQILRDEELHINFQSFTLRTMNEGRPRAFQFAVRQVQRLLLMGTIAVVWLHHGRVMKAGGIDLFNFAKRCTLELERSMNMTYDRAPIGIRQQVFEV